MCALFKFAKLVSRGLVEASGKGKEFGLAQVKEILLATPTPAAEEINAGILGQIRQFLGSKVRTQ